MKCRQRSNFFIYRMLAIIRSVAPRTEFSFVYLFCCRGRTTTTYKKRENKLLCKNWHAAHVILRKYALSVWNYAECQTGKIYFSRGYETPSNLYLHISAERDDENKYLAHLTHCKAERNSTHICCSSVVATIISRLAIRINKWLWCRLRRPAMRINMNWIYSEKNNEEIQTNNKHDIPCARASNLVLCDPNYIFSSVDMSEYYFVYNSQFIFIIFSE